MPYICGIYENRPEGCRKYPQQDNYQPKSCGFFFTGNGERRGSCTLECDSTCCKLPRRDGEPGGISTPSIIGGLSCKHLKYVDKVDFPENKETTVQVSGDSKKCPLRMAD